MLGHALGVQGGDRIATPAWNGGRGACAKRSRALRDQYGHVLEEALGESVF